MMSVLSDHGDGQTPGTPFETTISPGTPGVCFHRALEGRGGNTAASLVADLCADGSRLPVYWCSFYSPCLALFLPVFVEGELPTALSQGGATSTDISPWWQFREVSRAVYAKLDSRAPVVRERWAPLQASLLESAYHVAAEGRRLLDGGKRDEATRLLTGYMAENTAAMMSTVQELGDELEE
jgi:dipeptidase